MPLQALNALRRLPRGSPGHRAPPGAAAVQERSLGRPARARAATGGRPAAASDALAEAAASASVRVHSSSSGGFTMANATYRKVRARSSENHMLFKEHSEVPASREASVTHVGTAQSSAPSGGELFD